MGADVVSIFKNIDTTVKKKQGNLGVARAIYEYTKMGYVVLAPLSDSEKYDLVVDTGTDLLKVQVKTSASKPKPELDLQEGRCRYSVQIATSGGNTKVNKFRNREATDYDLLFVLVETGQCWSIPMKELSAGYAITVDLTINCKYNDFKI